jgi:hypothetical protein
MNFLGKDDPRMGVCEDAPPNIDLFSIQRPGRMRWWYALNRSDSDRWVNLPWWRLVVETTVDWPVEMETL